MRHLDLGDILPLDSRCLGGRDLHALLPFGFILTDLTIPLLLGHTDLGLIDGPGGGLLSKGLDVTGLVGNVLDIHVDQAQADLGQFDLHPGGDLLDQEVTVGVDGLNVHGGNDHPHLSEDDILPKESDLVEVEPQ